MFIAALFTIAKTWKQPKCPSTDECIKKMCVCVCVYNISIYLKIDRYSGILLSHKKNEILSSATEWKYLEGIRLCEISKRKRNTV